jgi:serine/threonine protein kinase
VFIVNGAWDLRAGPVPRPELVSLAVEVLEGLAELHGANIWHLDLKPPNILLDQYGHAYLSDFGISHALRTLEDCTVLTSTAGTPHYM